MQAKERSFVFMKADSYYDIPFFQRAYVWDQDNWAELLNNFLDHTDSHFLGSIILKQEQVSSGDASRFMVIDGQQRLTTLSILLRACYDRLKNDAEKYEKSVVDEFDSTMKSLLFIRPDSFSSKEDVKICHSKLDKPHYIKVIRGDLKDDDFDNKSKITNKIERCYLYFRQELQDKGDKDIQIIWDLLTKDKSKFLVNIDLGLNENEQKIFDTVNSYGVRLSSADTIKNYLFQFYIDAIRKSGVEEADVDQTASELYDRTWGKAFTADDDTNKYWTATKRYGRLSRDNIEVMLHAFAVIRGFFDPAVDNVVTLSQKYKDYTKHMTKPELEGFLYELAEYAETFRRNFVLFDSETLLSFDDYKTRLLHLCHVLDVATFYPYILKLLFQIESDGKTNEQAIKEQLLGLERYIVLNAICGGTTKNYNNECVQLVRERKTPEELVVASDDISRRSFDEGLRWMRTNKLPTAILFWIELFDRNTKYSDIKQLKYSYTLEHIMPQKWVENWPIEDFPVYNENGYVINDYRDAEEERSYAVYEIGNMTLLNSKLNTSLSNSTFDKKINGDGNKYKNCIRKLADLYLTKEIIDEPAWDERNIRRRTADLEKRIEEIWNIRFDEDKPVHLVIDPDNPAKGFNETFDDEEDYKDILYAIDRSDLSDDNKRKYKELLMDRILNGYIGGLYYEDDDRLFDKDTRETVEAICDSTDSMLAAALIAIDNKDTVETVKSYKRLFESGKLTNASTISEEDFVKYVFSPVANAVPGFYAEFEKELDSWEVDSVVVDLCKVLDEFFDAKDQEKRISIIDPLVEKYSDNTLINSILGSVFFDDKQWVNSIEYLEKCLNKEDSVVFDRVYYLNQLSYAYMRDSEMYSPEKAAEYSEALVELDPDGYSYERLGRARYLSGQYDDAIIAYKKCFDYDPTNAYAANDIVKAFAYADRLDEMQEFINNPPRELRKSTIAFAEKRLSNGN